MIEIRPVKLSDVPSLNQMINDVCAERRWLASVDGFSVEQTRGFVEDTLSRGCPHFVATEGERLVGWIDVVPPQAAPFRHVGYLGMGVLAPWRGRGLGRELLRTALRAARDSGLERVALEVYDDNEAAIRLYQHEGFETEGIRRRVRLIDGCYQDIRLMALSL